MLTAFWKQHEEREIHIDARFACISQLTKDGKPLAFRDSIPAIRNLRKWAPELIDKPHKRVTTPEEAVLLFQQSSAEGLNEMINFTALQNARFKEG